MYLTKALSFCQEWGILFHLNVNQKSDEASKCNLIVLSKDAASQCFIGVAAPNARLSRGNAQLFTMSDKSCYVTLTRRF
jgi:hypothetical protein